MEKIFKSFRVNNVHRNNKQTPNTESFRTDPEIHLSEQNNNAIQHRIRRQDLEIL